jgi:hypothetical protein
MRASAALAGFRRTAVARTMSARGGGQAHALGHCRGAGSGCPATPDDFLTGGYFLPFLGADRPKQIIAAADTQRELGLAIAIMGRHRGMAEQMAA